MVFSPNCHKSDCIKIKMPKPFNKIAIRYVYGLFQESGRHITLVTAERRVNEKSQKNGLTDPVRYSVNNFMNIKSTEDFTVLIKTPTHSTTHTHTHTQDRTRTRGGERCCISWETTWET